MIKEKDEDKQGKKDNLDIETEEYKMAVSMGVLPVLTGDIAKKIVDSSSSPSMDKDFLIKCSNLAKRIKKGTSKK